MSSALFLFRNRMLNTIAIYLGISLVLFVNLMKIKSPIIGFISSIIYMYTSSVLSGNIFSVGKGTFHKLVFGVSIFVAFLALGGSVALALYELNIMVIILLLLCITSFLIISNVWLYGLKKSLHVKTENKQPDKGYGRMFSRIFSVERVSQAMYILFATMGFITLLLSRSEETVVIWNVVNPTFLPLCFVSTFVLIIVLFSKVNIRTKLFLVMIHSLLIHCVLVVVLNPGYVGDTWSDLGHVRDIENHGKNVANLFEMLEARSSIYQIVYFSLRKRVLQALTMIFANMFSVDIYWSHILLTPVFWTLVPFFVYQTSKMLIGKRNNLISLPSILSAFFSISIPILVWWGSLTVSDTLSIVFFPFLVYLSSKYLLAKETKRSLIFLIILVSVVSLLTHFKTGVFCMSTFLVAFGVKRYEKIISETPIQANILLILAVAISSLLFPLSLLGLHGVYPGAPLILARFDINKFLSTDIWHLIFGAYMDFPFKELFVSLLIPLLGVIGFIYVLAFAPRKKYNRVMYKFLLLLVVIFIIDYRILKYAMTNVPMSAERMWVYRDILLCPLAAIAVYSLIQRALSVLSTRTWFAQKNIAFRYGSVALICGLLFSSLFIVSLENAYAKKPVLHPTNYEIQAIEYIHSTTKESYIVIGDTIFTYLAYSILGRYGGAGGYGSSAHYTRWPFTQMYINPSVEIMLYEMQATGSTVGYFVVSSRYREFRRTVDQAMEIFDIYGIFNDGNLYVFRYPRTEREHSIPIIVEAGNYSRIDYPIKYEINWTRALFGMPEIYLDPNSVRVIDENGLEVPSQLDGYQGLFENCSSTDHWYALSYTDDESEVSTDGDLLTCMVHRNSSVFPEKTKLVYSEFKMDGGYLESDPIKYPQIEIKWKESRENITAIRMAFWYRIGDALNVKYKWAWPSTEWSVWRYDYSSLLNETLHGFHIEIFEYEPGSWFEGNYTLYIDWMRFVSDIGTVRWLYSGPANTEKRYEITYDSLENTASGMMDGLPKKVYPDEIFYSEEASENPPYIHFPLRRVAAKVVDLLNQPLSDVYIEVQGSETKVGTDNNGWAYVDVPDGECTITASYGGEVTEKTIDSLLNSAVMFRLRLVKVDDFALTDWNFLSFVLLTILGCVGLLLFLSKKIIIRLI